MRLLTLPPLVLLLLLVFLWFILLVLLLWFALRPRRDTPRDTGARETRVRVQKKMGPSTDDPPTPARRPVVVRQTPSKSSEEGARDDAFDGYNRPANRRDDFDF